MDAYGLYIIPGGRGRGIALYVRKEIRKFIEKLHQLDNGNIQALRITFPSLQVIGTYIPPNTDSQDVISKLEAFVDEPNCVILGDFNFDFTKTPEHQIKSYLSCRNFHQHITGPTHYKGNIIDHIYTRGSFQIIHVKRLMSHYSDHFGVGICIGSQKK